MSRLRGACVALVLIAAGLATACARVITPPPAGGDAERALVAAVVARDVAAVERLLSSGARTDSMIEHEGHNQSAWALALNQARPGRVADVQIIQALLKAGASPERAWGTSGSDGGPRAPSVGADPPLQLAMLHPDAQVVQAILAVKPSAPGGQMALVMAIEEGDTEIAHLLVDAGVDVNCRPGANTPLVAAIEARDEALMHYLEEHGARENP
jgi:ankyrin repeat protein